MGQILSFYGADHKCGNSMIAQCFAEYTAKKYPDQNVMLIHAENGEGLAYSPSVGESLESIRPYMAEKLIDCNAVMEKSRYKDNLFIIGGAAKPGTSNLYNPAMAQYLFASLSENFDYVICDTGSEIEHAMALGALYCSDAVYVVSLQEEYCIRRFEWVRPLLSKISINVSGLIINQYDEEEVNDKTLISLRSGIDEENIFCLRWTKNGRRAQEENKTLLAYKDARFIKNFTGIADTILERCK